jgi:hypothetical protein
MTPAGQDEWPELMNAIPECTAIEERRRSLRVPLHWTLYLVCEGGIHTYRSETKNLSRAGFYCVLNEPLTAGEHVACDIVIPTHTLASEDVMSLRCRAQVLRVEKMACGEEYGLACRIEDYRLIHNLRNMGPPARVVLELP